MKEEVMAILRMLENGKISAEEAERLLNAVNNTVNKRDMSESLNNVLSKTGDALESFAQNLGKKAGTVAKTVGEKAEEAKPEIKKAAKAVKEKAGEAAETIKENIKKRKNDDIFEEESKSSSDYEGQKKDLKDFIPQSEEKDCFDEDNRDYEAEYNQMMKDTNGDIFGEVLNPINDALFEAQKEWEEEKSKENDGDTNE